MASEPRPGETGPDGHLHPDDPFRELIYVEAAYTTALWRCEGCDGRAVLTPNRVGLVPFVIDYRHDDGCILDADVLPAIETLTTEQ
jgi:hypothetical protein